MIIGIPKRIASGTGYLLFFLILAFPAAPGLVVLKAALLGVVALLIVLGALLHGRFVLAPSIGMLTFFFAAFGCILVLRSLLIAAPGAAKSSGVFVIWPFIYLVLAGGVASIRVLRGLEKTIVFSATCIGVLAILYFLSQLKLIPEIPYFASFLSDGDVGIGFYEGYIRMALPGINSLSFVVPFLMSALVVNSLRPASQLVPTAWLWLALLLSSFVVIVSGRRALELVTMLAPLLTLVIGLSHAPDERGAFFKALWRFSVTLVLGIVLIAVLMRPFYAISFSGFFDRFSSGFDFSPTSMDNSPDERRQQYFALERGWLEHPFFGAGIGEPAYGSIRSEDMPWAYELSYLALLFQTGLVGLAAYASGIAWVYWKSAIIISRGGQWASMMLPLVVGMTSYLIANATNPYLAKFDGLWTIFLPIAAINLWLVERETASSKSSALVVRPA